ncbi:MAG: glycine cleavage system aminomethyltransferase GcvT [candidate division WOR-3 bacterium]|nr:glycine cleavage system aminomethyltransferase GcvT [candidate division WOR-3 bacterium]MCX7836468.1 glycine cleavage system aminomethyltransferase GcvT [candidate division WOR-3 bacterium]MDW8114567.1 glycine cleavage system aminomethyltransferase GcvT [candidate division WOR-3 bacterium]
MLKKTPFYEKHLEYQGKMVNFFSYLMPISYRSIKEEVLAVRNDCGLFDVSHMGRIEISGKNYKEFVNYLITNDVFSLKEYQACYACMLYEDGGIVDDLVCYNLPQRILLVVNCANLEKDYNYILEINKNFNCQVKNLSEEICQLALQGKKAEKVLSSLVNNDLSEIGFYFSKEIEVLGIPMLVSRTGYTGEDGFELYFNRNYAHKIWDAFFEKNPSLLPCGLGARDMLRLEMGYCLYGQDIDKDKNPLEANLSFVVKFNKDFIGKEALLKIKEKGLKRKLVGIKFYDNVIPRSKMNLYDKNGSLIGFITSGTFSFSLNCGIAMGYVEITHSQIGNKVYLENKKEGEIVKLPFYQFGSIKRLKKEV